jgi:hypothetical protein
MILKGKNLNLVCESFKRLFLRKGSFSKTNLRLQNCLPLLSQFEKVCENCFPKALSSKASFQKNLMH